MSSETFAWFATLAMLMPACVAGALCRLWRQACLDQVAATERERARLRELVEADAGDTFGLTLGRRTVVLQVLSTMEVEGDAAGEPGDSGA